MGQGAGIPCQYGLTYSLGMRPSPPPKAVVPPSPGGSSDFRPVILLAEDELQIRKVFRLILERDGYRVLTACDGAEALAVSRAFPGAIQLLLTDVDMPKMDGPTLWGRLSHERPETKVLLMSGHIAVREFPFLQKPLTPARLKQAVHGLVPPGGHPA
jgi:DNA-binding NtrC family response regulator